MTKNLGLVVSEAVSVLLMSADEVRTVAKKLDFFAPHSPAAERLKGVSVVLRRVVARLRSLESGEGHPDALLAVLPMTAKEAGDE